MFFQLLSTIKVNLVAKIMQSAYLCVIFHVKHKKLPFLAVLTWFLILGKIQDGDHCWWRHRPPAAPPPIKYTSSCEEDQRLSTNGKIVSKYCNISKTPGRGSNHPSPPPLCTTVGVWICLYVQRLILIVWPRSVVTVFELLSLAEGGSKLSSLRIQPFLILSFPAQWMDVSAECFRWRLYSQATNYWEVRKTKKDRLMTG